MKALSLTQPWATLVAIGAKRIETRSWSTKYRGVVAIHAAKGFPKRARELCWSDPFAKPLGWPDTERPVDDLPLGAIVAVARLKHVFLTGDALNYRHVERTMRGPDGLTYQMTPTEIAFGDYTPGRFGWVLEHVIRLDVPVPCKGALGLWTVPPDIERQVRETEMA